MSEQQPDVPAEPEAESFGELVKYTGVGFVGGLLVAVLFDGLGLHRNSLGQWLIRTLAGEGESICEGLFALRRRLASAAGSMAESYGWGKLVGMTVPWGIDVVSRLAGVDVFAVEGFYIPFFYAMSDQIGVNVAGMVHLWQRAGGWQAALVEYVRHPVMLASLGVILVVPLGLFAARLIGFSPTTQLLTALETIAANLCWLPPLIGWMVEPQEGS